MNLDGFLTRLLKGANSKTVTTGWLLYRIYEIIANHQLSKEDYYAAIPY